MTTPVSVLVVVQGEGGTELYDMSYLDAVRCRKLLGEAVKHGEYPEEVNTIIKRAKRVKAFGTIDTSGDGWGWYKS